MTGTLGHIAATSFFPSKNLGAYGDGGCITTNSNKLNKNIFYNHKTNEKTILYKIEE